MKRTNRKGFTTVELVIVIAVIAILAAVLIPTFVSLINKANLSADQQAVRNMNLILKQEAAAEGAPETCDEAVAILIKNNYADFNTYSANTFLAWLAEDNIIVLVESIEGKETVLYPKEGEGKTGYERINPAALSVEDMLGLLQNGDGKTVFLGDNVEMTKAEDLAFNTAGNYSLNGGGKTLSTNVGGFVIENGANMTLSDILVEAGADITTIVSAYGDGVLTVDNATISGGNTIGILAEYGGTVTVSNTKVYGAAGANPVQCYGGNLTLNNVVITQSGNNPDKGYYNSAIQVVNGYGEYAQYDAHLTVNGGTYSGKIALQVSLPGGTIVINDGVFTGEEAIHMDSNGNSYANRSHSITINGGTFNGKIYAGTGSKITINGGTFTVNPSTVANVTVNGTVVANNNGTWTVK